MAAVRYYCPRCGAVATLDRDAYLADKSVTPHPLEGWEYADAYEEFASADGVEIVCGADETEGEGCGEVYYLNFVKYEDGEEVEPRRQSDVVPDRPTVSSREPDDDGPRFDFEP